MIATFRSLIQHNLAAKILALLVALILWGYVMNDQNPSIDGSFTVQLTMKNVPDGYKVVQSADTLKVRVRGPRSLFVNNDGSDFTAYVDLKDAQKGKNVCKVQIVAPQGFEVVEAKPDTVEVTLDPIVSKQVRADIYVNGSPAPGVTVAKVSQSSPEVSVEGPESAVNEVARVIGYVGLNGKNDSDFDLQVPLTAINADGREVQGVTVSPSAMYVSLQMARGLLKKIVAIQPVTGDDLSKDYELTGVRVDPAKIEIAGKNSVISGISSIETEKLSLTDVTRNTEKTVKLILPDGVTVTNHDVVVHITVRARKNE